MSRRGPGCSGCLVLVCLVVAVSLGLLASLASLGQRLVSRLQEASSAPPPRQRRPSPPPTTLRPRPPQVPVPRALNEFQRVSGEEHEALSWGFVDYERRIHHVRCRIDRAAHERELREFGFVPEAVRAELARRMLPLVRAALEERGHSAVVSLRAEDGTLHWSVRQLPEMARAMAEIRSVVDDVWGRHELRLKGEIYAERGFLIDAERVVSVDYGGIAERSSPLLRDCFESLARAGDGYDLGQYLGLFVAFLQEIPYELPPSELDGRRTGGFWVPTEVLVGNHGDCDSKSTAFCALWRFLGTPVLIVDLPKHVLVGVAVPPRAGQQWVRIGARTFVLCEVAGPGKLRPGAKTRVSGRFRYTLVEPTSRGFAVSRGSH